MVFLAAGEASVARRYATHLPEWVAYDRAGSIAAAVVVLAMLGFAVRIGAGLLARSDGADAAHAAR
jgi:cytochrome c oxidase subunit 1